MHVKEIADLESLPFQATFIKVFGNRESIRTCFHILLNEDFRLGRFHRKAGESLCRKNSRKDELGRQLPLFYEMEVMAPSSNLDEICLKCAEKFANIQLKKVLISSLK